MLRLLANTRQCRLLATANRNAGNAINSGNAIDSGNAIKVRAVSTSPWLLAKRWKNKTKRDYEHEFDNPVAEVAGMDVYPEKGYIVDKKPFKMKVEKYVEYVWCGCGYGRTRQPLCDQSCECRFLGKVIRGGPVRYIAPETKEVWFCNCKQTGSRPFCDGTHRSAEVQEARLDYTRELWEPQADAVKK